MNSGSAFFDSLLTFEMLFFFGVAIVGFMHFAEPKILEMAESEDYLPADTQQFTTVADIEARDKSYFKRLVFYKRVAFIAVFGFYFLVSCSALWGKPDSQFYLFVLALGAVLSLLSSASDLVPFIRSGLR